MEITDKYHKYDIIYKWKSRGVIYDDFDSLYSTYINTMNCDNCGKDFKTKRNRHLDHDHITGQFRKIVCCACNTKDSYLKYPEGTPSKNERYKIYREKNKEIVAKRKSIYYEQNKDKFKQYRVDNIDKIKEYREKNKEKMKEYRENNKDKIKETHQEKFNCDCGGKYTHCHKTRHFKTKKHLAYMETI